ncbi:MAG: 6-carboxytetrahydropterin synthase [Sedimentisphaerales bacterium]|nr:6-carboxytetrahydropterin synthase [Sedimentisphaerales bacterium]
MFTVSVQTRFRASHRLTLPDGSKEQAHTHNWLVTAEVCCSRLDRRGLVMDFSRLRAMVDNIVSELGGTALLENDYFKQNSPSAENVSKYIYQRLRRELPKGVKLRTVRVAEEPGCWAGFGR